MAKVPTPSERLFKDGANVLSNAELLSLFMDEDTAKAKNTLLFNLQSWRELMLSTESQFEALGIPKIALARVLATKELNERFLTEEMERGDALNDVTSVKKFLVSKLRDLEHEQFHVLFLDNKHRVQAVECHGIGTIDSASVHPREILKAAMKHNCSAVILAHNHPSGVSDPSQSDHRITDKIKGVLSLVDVRTLDHFIIGEDVLSFAEKGYL